MYSEYLLDLWRETSDHLLSISLEFKTKVIFKYHFDETILTHLLSFNVQMAFASYFLIFLNTGPKTLHTPLHNFPDFEGKWIKNQNWINIICYIPLMSKKRNQYLVLQFS